MSTQIKTTEGTYAKILGTGAYRPSRVVTNEEMCTMIDSTPEWIEQRTGIVERRWVAEGEDLEQMSYAAALQALERSGLTAEDLDCIIVSTVSHSLVTPSLAPILAHRLGTHAAAYDISAACAGFCYGLAQADGLIRAGHARHVLVIGAETLSHHTNTSDRSTAFLFGDGAGAAVVGPSDVPEIGPVVWGSDGANAHVINSDRRYDEPGEGAPKLTMEGQPVFKWASTFVARQTLEMLEQAGLTPDDLEIFIPHQANNRIIDAMMRTLRLPEHVVVARDIAQQGNTSSASIPLAIEAFHDHGVDVSGKLALIVGFGAGLVFAGQVVRLP
ncbi:beta-ketoacyl-ACP synthase III [Mariniluteicoccus flavus]